MPLPSSPPSHGRPYALSVLATQRLRVILHNHLLPAVSISGPSKVLPFCCTPVALWYVLYLFIAPDPAHVYMPACYVRLLAHQRVKNPFLLGFEPYVGLDTNLTVSRVLSVPRLRNHCHKTRLRLHFQLAISFWAAITFCTSDQVELRLLGFGPSESTDGMLDGPKSMKY